METMSSKEYKRILKLIGVAYLGNYSQSAKMVLNETVGNEITYSLYLAPWNLSGHQCCPNGEHCHELCLNASGRNRGDIIIRGVEESTINKARIKKTKLFFENKDLFMDLLIYELTQAKGYAERNGMTFSVRLNCTSDISPLAFVKNGEHILNLFPDVTFYDYTKVPSRLEVATKYPNYSLTFSFDGHNWDTCEEFLQNGINVAVVFESDVLPIAYKGYRIIDMTKTDLRYKDPKTNDGEGFVGFLHFHRPAGSYKSGKYVRPDNPFVVREDDPNVTYDFHTARECDE